MTIKTAGQDKVTQLSSQDFANYGVGVIAYIKPVVFRGEAAFAIHAADGTQLSVSQDFDVAAAAVRQHEMEPVRVH